ncbi:P-loop containing nucleoside triphosphate hydrolase protein [Suillus spraguei]|nr:P-loop containing nucleoside triphosphate hydrolase protein [Suillus spraguei]
MPTTSYALALIQLWIANPALPWSSHAWQSLTHIQGNPWEYNRADATAATHVAEWTVGKAQAVEAFLNNCQTAEDPAEHYSVKRKDNDYEGRSAWNAWVKKSWAKWNINKLLDNILKENGCEPHDAMARAKCKTPDDFPTLEEAQVKQVTANKLADALFGDDAFTDGSFLEPSVMNFVNVLLVLTWSREVEEQWLGKPASHDWGKCKTHIGQHPHLPEETRISSHTLSLFKDEETVEKLDARRKQVNAMLAAAKKDKDSTKAESIARLPKSLRDALDKLATEDEVKELEILIESTLGAMVPSDGDEVVIDFTEILIDDDLWEHLGLSEKKLPFFQTRTDPDATIDPWSEEGQQWLDDPHGHAQNLAPRWHQLVGILRLIDRVLDGRPVMLMDGVGVGKTMQAVGLIACLAHYREHYRKHGRFPGKFAQRSYKKSGGNIPDLPTVIMSPPNLQHQWMSEIQRYLRRATFDVLPYSGKYGARLEWWGKAWTQCQQPPVRRIILATTNAAQDDATIVFVENDRDSYGKPTPSTRFGRLSPNTLFGYDYNVTFFDEAHCARKYNKVHVAARGLQEKSHSMVAMTATPVTTSLRTFGLWRRDRKAQKEAGVESSILRGVLVGNHNSEAAQEEYLPSMKKWMSRMREWFSPAVILHLGLPPYYDHNLKIKLLDWEMENLRNIARGYLDDCPIVGMSKNFYVEFRRSILHPYMNPTEEWSWTKPKSLEEWDTSDTKSMKLDVLAKLLKYHLEADCRQSLMMDESGPFIMSNHAIMDILDLYGIHALELNGQTPMRKRKGILDEFRSSTRTKGARVLILSGVGMDTLWSEQDDRQLRGRIYRHPQTKEVHVYRAIALKTADVFLNNISFSKGAMHEAFVGAVQEFRCMFDDDGAMGDLISVGLSTPSSDNDSSDELVSIDHESASRNKAGKKKARPKATVKTPLTPTRPGTKHKGKRNKAKHMTVDTDDESESVSRKRQKGMELPQPLILINKAPLTSIKVVAMPQSQGGSGETPSLPELSTLKDTSAVLAFRDDCDSSSTSTPSLLFVQPPSTSPHSAPALAPITPTTSPTKEDKDRYCDVGDHFGHDSEMDWNDGGSNGGSGLAVKQDKQPPLQDRSLSFNDIFNKSSALSAMRSSSARPVAGMNTSKSLTDNPPRPRPRPRPRPLSTTKYGPSSGRWNHAHGGTTQARLSHASGQIFNPVPLGIVPAHSGRFSSKDRMRFRK